MQVLSPFPLKEGFGIPGPSIHKIYAIRIIDKPYAFLHLDSGLDPNFSPYSPVVCPYFWAIFGGPGPDRGCRDLKRILFTGCHERLAHP